MRRFLLTVSFSALIFPLLSFGQVEPSSELLLRPAEKNSPNEAGLESGRYKVKKSKGLPSKKVVGTEVDANGSLSKATAVVLPVATTPTTTTSTSTTTTTTLKEPKVKKWEVEKALFVQEPEKKIDAPVEKSVEVVETKESIQEPAVSDQVRDLVMGHEQATVEAYKEQVHPDDIRLNRIEINILPGVLSNNSRSSYSYRNYSSFSPKALVGANLWMTPFLGVSGNYTTSMGADVAGDIATQSRTSARHEWTELGLDIRKFFGMSRKSNSVEYGIHLSEYKFSVPGDDLNRVKLKSSGVGIHFRTRIPVAPSYSWVFGGKLIPRVQHSEDPTGIALSSGSLGESSRVDFNIGGEFKMARQSQIIWDLTTSFEKNQFNGQADLADPETGSKPKGVSVENTFLIFSLGFRWGQ